MNVRFTSRALRQLTAAADWHLQWSGQAARRFLAAFDRTIIRLQAFPQSSPRIVGELRRAQIRGSEYGIFYVVRDVDVVILAILHGRQSPEEWERLDLE